MHHNCERFRSIALKKGSHGYNRIVFGTESNIAQENSTEGCQTVLNDLMTKSPGTLLAIINIKLAPEKIMFSLL